MNIRTVILTAVIATSTSVATSYFMGNKVNNNTPTTNLKAPPTPDIKQELAKIIQSNPEIIIDSLTKAQEEKARAEESQADEIAKTLRTELEQNPTDGQAGNKDGDVVMVAFLDHNCGFCKKSEPDIEKLLLGDPNLKFAIKDFPILGQVSVEKSKASIAIAKIAPEKWYDFYKELNRSNPQSIEQVFEITQNKFGIDTTLLKTQMESKETQDKLAENRALGDKLAISGTPAFIINGKVIKGALGYDAFKATIEQIRAGK